MAAKVRPLGQRRANENGDAKSRGVTGAGDGSIPSRGLPCEMVEIEIFDDADFAMLLNELIEECSQCGSRTEPLSALVYLPTLEKELSLCGECYRNLSELSQGHVD